jgi:predicted MFS family arabinose efflux permease
MPIFREIVPDLRLRGARRNLPILYSMAFLQGLVFYAPIATLYRTSRGLTLAQLAVTESVMALASLAMELPWGILADRIGYRRTMILCSGLYFASKVVFWQAYGFGMFLLERLLLAVTFAGLSGVDSSMLYLSCPQGESQRAFGVYNACGAAGMVCATVGYIAFVGEEYSRAAFATMVCYGLAFTLSLGLCDVQHAAADRPRQSVRGFLALLRQTLRARGFLAALLGCALYSECVHTITTFLNQPQYLRCGLSVQGIGWAYLALNALDLCGAWSHKLTARLGRRKLVMLVFGLSAAACATLAFTRSAAASFGMFALLAALSSVLAPLVSELQNRQVTTADRATQLSIYALCSDFAMAGADYALCAVADRSLTAAFVLCAILCVLGVAGGGARAAR